MTVFNLGSINIDHVYRLSRLPAPGETLASESYSRGLGGKGANQSVAAARAGARVRHVGAIGPDDWLRDRMAGYGVDTDAIARADTATGHAIILVDGRGENAIILHPGANHALDADAVAAALSGLTPGDTLLLQNETTLQVEAARIARKAGARVIYSAAPFDVAAVHAILPHADLLAMNEGEAAALAEALGTPEVAMLVTLGPRGAEYRAPGAAPVAVPGFKVEAVDTTGAGDCFAGNFAAALDRGDTPAAALHFAVAASALQVTRPGAGDAMPTRAETEAFLKDHA